MIKANRHFFSILATLYNHKLALLENFYLFRMKMCSRTSFEHLFKKDASFFFSGRNDQPMIVLSGDWLIHRR